MQALVTGGAGFIGSTLTERLLAEGHSVDVVDDLSTGTLANLADARASAGRLVSFHQLDVRSDALVDLVRRRRPDVVFHLADRRHESPVETAEVTVVGTVQVLEAARIAGTRKVVFASDDSVGKRAATDYLCAYRDDHDLEFTSLVLGSVYGPRQWTGVVAAFATALRKRNPCTIFGDGRQSRDFVFIDDVVDAVARAVDRGDGLVIEIGTGVQTTVRDLYAHMESIAGVELPTLAAPPRRNDSDRVDRDPARAAIHLGWRPWTDLATGLAAVLNPPS